MNGSKMKGKWALIRMNHAAHGPNDKPQWLLIKEHDKYERGSPSTAITDAAPELLRHRPLHRPDRRRPGPRLELQPRRPPPVRACPAKSPPAQEVRAQAPPQPTPPSDLDDLPRERQPDFIPPQLALETTSTPNTDDWIHELKLDGYRIQARKSRRQANVQLLTRKGIDWTHRMPTIAKAVATLPVHDCTLDGEVVVLSTDGNSSFALLQASFQNAETHPLTYFVFDLLHLDGHDPRDLSLRERKAAPRHRPPSARGKRDADDTSASPKTSPATAKPSSATPAPCTPKASSPSAPTHPIAAPAPPTGSSPNASTSRSSSSPASPSPAKAPTASAPSSSATTLP